MKKYLLILSLLALNSLSVHSQDFIKMTNSIVSIDSGASRSVNWIDYDNDNDLDLFISTGYRYGDNNYLYRNENGTFTKFMISRLSMTVFLLTEAAGEILIMTDYLIFA